MRVLVTGPTGLLGSALVATLLRRGHRILAVARPRGPLGAGERIRRLLRAQGGPAPGARLRVFEAARGAPAWAGLAEWLAGAGPVEAVLHTAAAVKFTCTREELWQENLVAPAVLLDALDHAAPQAAFHFLSTAYICGERRGVCRETERACGQSFRHPYEESKLLAEELVARRCATSGRPLSVYRPSIIGGDSLTGAAANFNGLGGFLRSLEVLARSLRPRTARAGIFIRCDPTAGKNVVPVDWAARTIAVLLERGAAGRCYHLTHPRPIVHREILEFARAEFRIPELAILPSREESLPVSSDPAGPARDLLPKLSHLAPYLWGEPSFDRTNLVAELGAAAEPPPVDGGYLRRLAAFGRSTGWSSFPLEAEGRARRPRRSFAAPRKAPPPSANHLRRTP